jgi:hypothetical protein
LNIDLYIDDYICTHAEFAMSLDPNNPDSGTIDFGIGIEEKIQLLRISLYVPFSTSHAFVYIYVGSTIIQEF